MLPHKLRRMARYFQLMTLGLGLYAMVDFVRDAIVLVTEGNTDKIQPLIMHTLVLTMLLSINLLIEAWWRSQNRLHATIEALGDGFALFGRDALLIHCNVQFAKAYAAHLIS